MVVWKVVRSSHPGCFGLRTMSILTAPTAPGVQYFPTARAAETGDATKFPQPRGGNPRPSGWSRDGTPDVIRANITIYIDINNCC